jgi:hypothetical protein
MIDRTPLPRDQRPPIPAFAPVPRQCQRHDGWTPERQRAFIEALADTGSVSTACRMVNMASVGAYALRRHPQAAEFRRAWEAALDMGVQRLKDEAFERAINGQLVPVFVAGKLLGFRRKKNDRLLMFCLRHYGQDQQGRRVTINYFSTRASAAVNPPRHEESGQPQAGGADSPHAPPLLEGRQAVAQAATTLTTTTATALPAPDRAATDDQSAQALAGFEGIDLDSRAQSEILAILESCAARRRDTAPQYDPERVWVPVEETGGYPYAGELEPGVEIEDAPDLKPGEVPWTLLGNEPALAAIDAAIAATEAEQALPRRKRAALDRQRADAFGATARRNNAPAKPAPGPRLSELPETGKHHVMHGGPNFQQRNTARRATAMCIDAARREWIAAESEESWEVWKARPR